MTSEDEAPVVAPDVTAPVADAAEAQEVFGDDALEAYAAGLREDQDR